MKRCLIFVFFAIVVSLLTSCDGGENHVNGYRSGIRNYTYSYYYIQSCYYDNLENYQCYNPKSMNSSLRISFDVDVDGFVELYYNDNHGNSFRTNFLPDEYSYAINAGTYYYQFPMESGDLTVYENGSEAIYTDYRTGTEDHYFYDLFY